MWLFGQLDTLGQNKLQQQTDEKAQVVAGLLQKLVNDQSEMNRTEGEGGNVANTGEVMQVETSSDTLA
jgi:hypothetical protein